MLVFMELFSAGIEYMSCAHDGITIGLHCPFFIRTKKMSKGIVLYDLEKNCQLIFKSTYGYDYAYQEIILRNHFNSLLLSYKKCFYRTIHVQDEMI